MRWLRRKVAPRSNRAAELRAEGGFGQAGFRRANPGLVAPESIREATKKMLRLDSFLNQCRVVGPEFHRAATTTPEPR